MTDEKFNELTARTIRKIMEKIKNASELELMEFAVALMHYDEEYGINDEEFPRRIPEDE